LLDPSSVRVDVSVDETDVAKVRMGMPAQVTFEALPEQRLQGRVVGVGLAGTVSQGVVTYPISIGVETRDPLPSGLTASASIVIDQKDDVVLVPNRAVRTQGRSKTVEVITGETKNGQPVRETRQVQIGMSNEQVSEVLAGLNEGDRVVIPTTTTAAARAPGLGVALGGAGGGPVQAPGR
jgi:HlyD family secretion protein